MDKYSKIKVLGKGSFGVATLIKRKSDSQLFVSKEVNLQRMNPKEREEARNEVRVLQKLQHPNIVRYIEHSERRGTLFIIMEYADGGDLHQKIKAQRNTRMKEETILHYFGQIALALDYLHSRHILHRDMKSMNVFLTSNGTVKLGDFGISTVLRNTMGMANTVCGTPYYFSPELCKNRPYNNKSDVWALGVILYELAALKHPFDGTSMNQLMQRIVRSPYSPISASFSPSLRQLLAACLEKEHSRRPTVKALLGFDVMTAALSRLQQDLNNAAEGQMRLQVVVAAREETAVKPVPAPPRNVARGPIVAPVVAQHNPAGGANPVQAARDKAALRDVGDFIAHLGKPVPTPSPGLARQQLERQREAEARQRQQQNQRREQEAAEARRRSAAAAVAQQALQREKERAAAARERHVSDLKKAMHEHEERMKQLRKQQADRDQARRVERKPDRPPRVTPRAAPSKPSSNPVPVKEIKPSKPPLQEKKPFASPVVQKAPVRQEPRPSPQKQRVAPTKTPSPIVPRAYNHDDAPAVSKQQQHSSEERCGLGVQGQRQNAAALQQGAKNWAAKEREKAVLEDRAAVHDLGGPAVRRGVIDPELERWVSDEVNQQKDSLSKAHGAPPRVSSEKHLKRRIDEADRVLKQQQPHHLPARASTPPPTPTTRRQPAAFHLREKVNLQELPEVWVDSGNHTRAVDVQPPQRRHSGAAPLVKKPMSLDAAALQDRNPVTARPPRERSAPPALPSPARERELAAESNFQDVPRRKSEHEIEAKRRARDPTDFSGTSDDDDEEQLHEMALLQVSGDNDAEERRHEEYAAMQQHIFGVLSETAKLRAQPSSPQSPSSGELAAVEEELPVCDDGDEEFGDQNPISPSAGNLYVQEDEDMFHLAHLCGDGFTGDCPVSLGGKPLQSHRCTALEAAELLRTRVECLLDIDVMLTAYKRLAAIGAAPLEGTTRQEQEVIEQVRDALSQHVRGAALARAVTGLRQEMAVTGGVPEDEDELLELAEREVDDVAVTDDVEQSIAFLCQLIFFEQQAN